MQVDGLLADVNWKNAAVFRALRLAQALARGTNPDPAPGASRQRSC